MSSLPSQPEDLNGDAGELPDALAAELRNAYGRAAPVPPSLDANILREARAGFARRRRFRLAARGALVTAGAAAAVGLAFVIPAVFESDVPQSAGVQPGTTQMLMVAPPAAASEDVDRDGKVDILDAFVVARLIDARAALDRPAYDVNGDGAVDRADVDRIAMAAVDTSSRRAEEDGDEHARVQ